MNSKGISVGILTESINADLIRCISSIRKPPSLPLEILVINHCIRSNTASILTTPRMEVPIRTFNDPENNLGKSRDFILRVAEYHAVAFIDSDCVAPPDWLNSLYSLLCQQYEKNPCILGVGGGNYPPTTDRIFYRSLFAASRTVLGNGNSAQMKVFQNTTEVDHLPTCNILLWKQEAIRNGGFSHQFAYVCEDMEFSRRVNMAGKKFLYLPSAGVTHWHNPSYFLWTKKMFRYGRGQILVFRLHKSHLFGIRGLPLFALLLLIVSSAFSLKTGVILFLLYLYSIATAAALFGIKYRSPALSMGLFYLFFCTHIPYGLGQLFELLRLNRKKQNGEMNQRN